ncbi:Neurexin-4 [Chionoecetes opilio]|uniref:Neurexin-4 n=1 Tax=Chionoecetes opilio TaxID=41210 RepID=A0A8J5D5B9_CHIOP|nr:Neurexin-4 [Chionoecetes opilio]
MSADQTLTFLTRQSHLQYPAFEDQRKVNVSLEFRTYEEKGVLIYHKFTGNGFFKLFLEEGKVKVEVEGRGTPGVVALDNFDTPYNDGQWHKAMFIITENHMELSVDGVPMKTVRIIAVVSGKYFMIAGGVYGSPGFLGCLRKISVVGYMQKPKDEVSYIHPSTHTSTHTPIYPLTHPAIHSYIHSYTHLSTHTSSYPLIHPLIHPFIHSHIQLSTHTSTHTPIYPLTHPPIHSYIHSYTHLSTHTSSYSLIQSSTHFYPHKVSIYRR